MKKFMVLYHAPKSVMEQMKNKSPEEMKKMMSLWKEWSEKVGSALVDMGNPLGVSSFLGGEGSSDIGYYSFVQAESMDEAKALFEGNPHLKMGEGCTIEVLECMPMPEM